MYNKSDGLTEWCLFHMLNRVLVDAFGMSEDRRRAKSLEARELCDEPTRTIEAVRKSKHNTTTRGATKQLQEDSCMPRKQNNKVVDYAAHR